MVTRKYTQDYKLEYYVGPGGGLRSRPVYVGCAYGFLLPEARARVFGRRALAMAAAGFCLWLLPLLFDGAATRAMYALLPWALFPLPLGLLGAAALRLWRDPLPLTRQQADKISLRYPASALWMLILSGASALGFGVRAVTGFQKLLLPGDLLFGLCALLLAGLSALLFVRRDMVKTRKLPETDG